MPLVVTQTHTDQKDWRKTVERYATAYGLQLEVLEAYDRAIKQGTPPNHAAWSACYDWDLCDFVQGDEWRLL